MVAMHEVLSLTPFLTSLLALLLVSPIIIYLLKPRNHGLPPAPPAIPIIGHLHLLKPPMHRTLHELTTRYGPLIHLRLGSSLSIATGSVDMAREVLKNHDTIFSERPSTVAARKFAYETAGFAFAPYGEYWRFVKRLCMSELLGPRTLEQLRPIRQSEVAFLLRSLLEKSRVGEAVNLSKELIKLTNNIITRMVASSTAGDEAEVSRRVVKQVAEVMGTFNAEDYIGFLRGLDIQGLNKKMREVHRNFDNLLEGFITAKEKSRNKAPERGSGEAKETPVKDLLDILLDVAGDPTAEVKITRENIKGFILDIFTAGTDSSASTIEWTLSELINHPKIMQKLREEIDRIVGKDRVVGEADVPNLPYLNAVVKEIMRIHPAAPIAYRISTKETIIGGYTIPANTTVAVNLYSTGRDPKYWVNPDEFRPERFFEESNTNLDVKGLHYQLIPFGSGRRVCPGIGFALQVVPAALAALVQCFEWKIDEGTANENGKVDMEEGDGGLVSYRAKPLVVVPIPRLNPFPLN
ncbi:cytochrome P450 93A2-like protein [Carex littledalei]|uniref:Cytochrome P450 93A2-like protein n=1 Tax=Carex littledalei TaxID=544730 RepID=A0A833VQK4_9POAL|nr:cytochrome P450 93A2-like protein [Carex littledalei]